MNPKFSELLSVFVVGPFLFGMSQVKGELSREEKDFLAFVGVATVAFNMASYLIKLKNEQGTIEPPEQDYSA